MEREIALEGCANFRDLGGYPADGGRLRWRTLFRSDALHELTPADEDVIADYAMTGRNLVGIRARLERHAAYDKTYAYVPRDAMTADAGTMRELIADLRARHGDMRGLLRHLGLGDDVVTRLRAALVTA